MLVLTKSENVEISKTQIHISAEEKKFFGKPPRAIPNYIGI